MGEAARPLCEATCEATHYNSTESVDRLVTQRILQAIPGGAKGAARAVGISDRGIYQWAQDPDKSGIVSPIRRFLDFVMHVTAFNDEAVNTEVLELLKPALTQMGIEPVSRGALAELRRACGALMPNESRRLDEATPMCPHCDSPLRWVPEAGGWYCGTCRGK